MRAIPRKTDRAKDRGSALLMAVFVLVLLTGMGTALLFLSRNESKMGQASLRLKKSFYLAESGIEDARVTLFHLNTDNDFNNELADAAANGTFDFDPDAVEVLYDGNGNVTGLQGFGDDVPLRPLTTLATSTETGWYATFLTNDAIDNAMDPLADTNDRVLLTAIGAGPGQSMEVVQAVIRPYVPLPPVPGAALAMLGPDPSFDNGTSAAQSHTGNDCGVAGGPYAPIVGAVGGSATGKIRSEMHRPEKFAAGPYVEEPTVADLADDSTGIVADAGHGVLDPFWTDCPALTEAMEDLAFNADYYCNSDYGACTIPPTAVNSIVFIDGDLASTPAGSFTGILAITGTLTYNGTTGWDGVILAIGEGRIERSGGGANSPSGAVVMANIDPTPNGPNADKSDWCSTPPDGFAAAVYATTGGGTSDLEWCSNNITAATSIKKYKVVEFLQR